MNDVEPQALAAPDDPSTPAIIAGNAPERSVERLPLSCRTSLSSLSDDFTGCAAGIS
jgi:hypothetical protein